MFTKILEIRDRGTRIDVLAVQMMGLTPLEREYLRVAGYPVDGRSVVLMRLSDQKATNDPWEWPGLTGDRRTLPTAHEWILGHWNELQDGQVVDVEWICGEAPAPKLPERLERKEGK